MAQQAAVKRTTPTGKPVKKPKVEKIYPFKWEGKDRSGNKVAGEMQGTNQALVKAHLRKQGVLVTRIHKKSSLFGARAKKIKPLDIAFFTRQLASEKGNIQRLDFLGAGTE